jgi:nicotinate-nucleotide--dimethylbenzimidazole phosphoribosyltransferase
MIRPMIQAPHDLNAMYAILKDLPGPAETARAATQARESTLTKPPGALGRLEDIAAWLSAWQDRAPPAVRTPAVLVFAGNHGVAAQGVSAFPPEVTMQMVANFNAGGAAVNQLSLDAGATFRVVPLDLDQPTADFSQEPAMSEDAFMAAFNVGWTALPDGCDLLAVGEMGIANTTAAAALSHALFGGLAQDWTGPGTGVAGAALTLKAEVVERAVTLHGPKATGPMDMLRRLGGRELVAMAGAIVAARMRRVPVLLDGYVCGAAAAALAHAAPGALDHTVAAHVSAEPGHQRLLDALGLKPLLDLNMRLGEASGAALAINIVRAAAACHAGMATFADAGISGKDA